MSKISNNFSSQLTFNVFLFIAISSVSMELSHSKEAVNYTYEDDSIYEESPPRNDQAIHVMTRDGEKAIRAYFEFPVDTLDEPNAVYGIDISHHNGEIEWDNLPDNSVIFSVAKATEGVGFYDSQFKKNWAELKKHVDASILTRKPRFFRGAYHFFTPSDPLTQAKSFIEQVGDLNPGDLPPTLDLEWTSFNSDRWKKYSGEEIARRALIWLDTIEKHYNRKPIIYTNAAWWSDRGIESAELSKYPLWIANYSKKSIEAGSPHTLPSQFSDWYLWQFTDRGFFLDAPNKSFDVNRFNGSLDQLLSVVDLEQYNQESSHSEYNLQSTSKKPENCLFDSLNKATAINGKRSLALVVGVSRFLADNHISELKYSTKDARAFADLLINSYDFPKENVCLLLDEEATISNVRKYFSKITELIASTKDNTHDKDKDTVVFYASTHGSLVNNHPDDQSLSGLDHEIYDGKDSTLLLYDSWVDGTWDLVDDEMYELLGKILIKTPNLSVFIDACYSGSLTKGVGRTKFIQYRPPLYRQSKPSNHKILANEVRDKLVYFGASQDSQTAIELDSIKHGVFTESLLRNAKPISNAPLTYSKLRLLIIDDLQKNNRTQIPVMTGPGSRVVFGNAERTKPGNYLSITQTTPVIRLSGLPIPGLGEGSLFSVFDGNIKAKDVFDTRKIKGRLKITTYSGGEAIADIMNNTQFEVGDLSVGDIAIMTRPSDDYRSLRVYLRPESKLDGLPANLVDVITRKIKHPRYFNGKTIQLVENDSDLSIQLLPSSVGLQSDAIDNLQILIRSTSNNRNYTINYNDDESTADSIVQKLNELELQKKYLSLTGNVGADFEDNVTLDVSILEVNLPPSENIKTIIESKGIKCPDQDTYPIMRNDKKTYKIPVCTGYKVKVSNTSPTSLKEKPLYVGLLVLGSSGSTDGYPRGPDEAVLKPGETLFFPLDGTHFVAAPPIGNNDVLIVIGTQDKRTWRDLRGSRKDALKLNAQDIDTELNTWTLSRISIQLYNPADNM
ncbi:MAG: GH25 family lysozyme [Candidatus Thiodiazotropha endolucinida]